MQPDLDGTVYDLPQAPAPGIEVDEDMLAGDVFRFWQAPLLRRDDGALTNWWRISRRTERS